jgi:iron(III) transport system ATP-binding protein
MREGKLAQVGTPEDVYIRPADIGIATFLGDAIVLPATIHNGKATCWLGRLICHGSPPDGPADIVIRPEQILIGGDRPEVVRARVTEVTYYGPFAALKLCLPDMKTSITARASGFATPHVDDAVDISVHGQVMAYPK